MATSGELLLKSKVDILEAQLSGLRLQNECVNHTLDALRDRIASLEGNLTFKVPERFSAPATDLRAAYGSAASTRRTMVRGDICDWSVTPGTDRPWTLIKSGWIHCSDEQVEEHRRKPPVKAPGRPDPVFRLGQQVWWRDGSWTVPGSVERIDWQDDGNSGQWKYCIRWPNGLFGGDETFTTINGADVLSAEKPIDIKGIFASLAPKANALHSPVYSEAWAKQWWDSRHTRGRFES
jgi:hypothetical protein